MTGFTMERRERFLALLSVGHTVESAAAVAGTSRQTVVRWAARGRVPGAPAEAAGFAQRLDAIRDGKAEDVARHREAEAEAEPPPDHPWRWVLDGDPFAERGTGRDGDADPGAAGASASGHTGVVGGPRRGAGG